MKPDSTDLSSTDLESPQKQIDTRKPGPWNGTAGPGRPKGMQNKLTLKQREVAAMVLGEPGTPEFDEFVKSERADWKAGTMHPGVKQMWMHYLVGKPKETIDVKSEVTVEKIVREVIRLPEGDVTQHEDAVH